jgi:hypothetical protein
MSERSRSLESTRHCIADRKPKGTAIYLAVAVLAVIAGLTSRGHVATEPPEPHISKLVQ